MLLHKLRALEITTIPRYGSVRGYCGYARKHKGNELEEARKETKEKCTPALHRDKLDR